MGEGHNHGSIGTTIQKEREQRINYVRLRETSQFARSFTRVWRAKVPGGIRRTKTKSSIVNLT